MSTIVAGNGSFIAGETPTVLPEGTHWCRYCAGDGLEDYGDGLTICGGCDGRGVIDCTDTACVMHSTLHPFDFDTLTLRQMDGIACVRCDAEHAIMIPIGRGPTGQVFACERHYRTVM